MTERAETHRAGDILTRILDAAYGRAPIPEDEEVEVWVGNLLTALTDEIVEAVRTRTPSS